MPVYLAILFERLENHCSVIKNAIINTIGKHNVRTEDIGGQATTTEFMKCVLDEIQSLTPEIGLFLDGLVF